MYLKKIYTKDRLPEKPGKYLIETESSPLIKGLNNINRLEARFNGSTFDINNQVVTAWFMPFEISKQQVDAWELQYLRDITLRTVKRDPQTGIETRSYVFVNGEKAFVEIPIL